MMRILFQSTPAVDVKELSRLNRDRREQRLRELRHRVLANRYIVETGQVAYGILREAALEAASRWGFDYARRSAGHQPGCLTCFGGYQERQAERSSNSTSSS